MIGIRAKLMLFMSTLVIIISTLSCVFFLIHAKRQQEETLKNFGMSLVMLLAQDHEVKYAMTYTQPAFLDAPVKRIRALDREEEIGYLRISNVQTTLMEEKTPWMGIDMKEIPIQKGRENQEILYSNCMLACSQKAFYDFSLAVTEEKTFSEEAFAAQVLEEITMKAGQHPLGFIQIGLSSHKLGKRIHRIFWKSVIPLGLIIISGGISTIIFLTKYLVSPLRQMANVTLDIAKGDLTRTVDVQSYDEIGQLSVNFNKMTRSLKKSYDDLKQEIVERRRAEGLLGFRVKIEELIAAISTNFINLPPSEVDAGIDRALQQIGEFSDVDRSYVFLNTPDGKKIDNTHEWCAKGILPQKENLQGVFVEQFPWGMEKLRRFETLHIPRINDLPEDAKAERALQQSQEVQSCVIVPMIYGGSLMGLLGFDSVRREKTWTQEDIAMLKMVAEIFVNALEHKRMEEALRKANSELELRVEERTLELSKTNAILKEEIVEHKKARDALRKYEILISEMTDLAYICDTEGNIVFVNPTFEKLTSHPPEEFIGKSFAPLFDDENYKKGMRFYTNTLEGESPRFEIYFKDTGVLCEYNNMPLRDDQGNIIGVIGIARDITERKRMENILRETNQTLQAIILASPLAITVLDSRGCVKIWNPSAERIFGWKEQEVLGHGLPIVSSDKQHEFIGLRDQVLRGESFMVELWRRRKDGSLINISLSTAPLYGHHGNVEGILGIMSDNTERQKMMNDLQQAKDYAENLIETANIMVVELDVMGNIQIFNKVAEEITGYKKEEIIGRNWFEVIVPRERNPYVWEEFSLWQSGGPLPKTMEAPVFTKLGKKRYVSWQNSEVREQGKTIGTISFGVDITEQKRNKELVERIRLMAFLKDIGIALTASEPLREMLSQCTDAVVSNLDVAFTRIWTFNEKENILELQASSGRYTHIDGAHGRIPLGKYKIGIIARDRQPHLINSVINDPHISDKEWVQREGIVAFAGYPLIVKDRLVGVIAMFAQKAITEFAYRAFVSAGDIIALGIDRKQAEEALRTSERKYRMLLENLPQRVFYKDENLRYVSCNENYARDLKISPDEIAGKADYDFYPEALAEKYRSDDKRIMMLETTEDIEEKYIRDGQEFTIHTVKTPIKDEKGKVIGVLGIFWDITEKIALQMEAIRSRHLASIGELAATVAHEINNPITGIINCAQILVNKSGKGSKGEDMGIRIVKEGKRIADIVKSLLSLARPGDRKEQKGSVCVSDIVSDTLTLVDSQLKKDCIALVLNLPYTLPRIRAHHQQIQQVFLNVISNARYALNAKYPGRHENKMIEIRGEAVTMDHGRWVKITFHDTGAGIPSDILDKVMNPFFSTKPRGKGTGLGLSISHSIVKDHDGKLLIDSAEGEFTDITIVLPSV
ncbi:MAG: hypothetical protein B6D35_13485 [Candidatus Brocadia sp. UTAMX2]|jgi:PAS domain S-box-containing protein|nr:MAG: hypothetical protein B6D35_13485 [Candidatus Brocadia sp. UTAMX2]